MPEASKPDAAPDDRDELRPLTRLRRLAQDIESALERDDMETLCQAAELLAPALRAAMDAPGDSPARAARPSAAAEAAMQARAVLLSCEDSLSQALSHTAGEMRRLRQGRRAAVPYTPGG